MLERRMKNTIFKIRLFMFSNSISNQNFIKIGQGHKHKQTRLLLYIDYIIYK